MARDCTEREGRGKKGNRTESCMHFYIGIQAGEGMSSLPPSKFRFSEVASGSQNAVSHT